MSGEHQTERTFATKLAITTFAYAVGLAIFLTIDHLTGWIGIVH